MTDLPNGLLGKAYVVPVFVFAAIVVTIIGVLIVAMPFWLVASIFAAMILVLLIFIVWAGRQPTTGYGQ
jgi:hypothetical protein